MVLFADIRNRTDTVIDFDVSDVDIDQELEGFDMEVDPDAWRFDVSSRNGRVTTTVLIFMRSLSLILNTHICKHFIDCQDPSTNDAVENFESEQTRFQE